MFGATSRPAGQLVRRWRAGMELAMSATAQSRGSYGFGRYSCGAGWPGRGVIERSRLYEPAAEGGRGLQLRDGCSMAGQAAPDPS